MEGKHMYSKRALSLAMSVFAAFAIVSSANAAEISKVNIPDVLAGQTTIDDGQPDVTARVARISFIEGSVQLRRADSDVWEQATLNLPIVEGDEITTDPDARVEIQFDAYTHLRMAENGYLKVLNLKDEGIALSVPQGTISFHLTEFNRDKAYFEVDAPGSTVAVQQSGSFRIDAGKPGDQDIRVSVTDAGEARIYSATSGLLLKDGRSARIYVDGRNAGEWETGSAQAYTDDFDSWTSERDEVIARSLQNADYDKYYDSDIYGAEDLNNYGEWVYSRDYGYVWRPSSSAISAYVGWSPYRFGQWRWVPPFGWTWVNDEPWGWATYHHGRWFYDNGYWYWTPYGAIRYARSWWSPALVYITTYGGNICWYPLPYSYPFYNYNYYYYTSSGWPGHHHGGNNGGSGGGGAGPTPTPTPPVVAGGPLSHPKGPKTPPLGTVPPTGVVTVETINFGKRNGGTRRAAIERRDRRAVKDPDRNANGSDPAGICRCEGSRQTRGRHREAAVGINRPQDHDRSRTAKRKPAP